VLASIGSVGDALDNALAERFVDSFKTELIADRVWRSRSQLELAIVEYVAWLNDQRLHQSLDDLPPAEFEALCARQTDRSLFQMKRGNQLTRAPRDPARLTVTHARLVGRDKESQCRQPRQPPG
jgi:Integrase core domain